jgi:uncharacterized membrane-anchored protein
MRTFVLAVAALLVGALLAHAWAQPQAPSREERERAIVRAAGELKPQSGAVTLANGIAKVTSERLLFLSPQDTEKLLVDIWGNPRGVARNKLGALVPRDFDPLSADSWAIILSYSADGHVSDDDAAGIDYAELLSDMKQGVRESNEERKRQGGNELELLGWARQPYYDKTTHKLHWAMHLRSVDGDSLNYNVRVLGREGVLVLNFIAPIESLPEIEKAIPTVLADVNFTDGNRYDQFNASTDRLAEYGVAALIAGGVLKKVGFFGAIIAAILAAKKFVIIGVIALVAVFGSFFKRLFRGSRLPPPTQPPAA